MSMQPSNPSTAPESHLLAVEADWYDVPPPAEWTFHAGADS